MLAPVQPKILGYEFKNAFYVESQTDRENDAVFVKEIIHYDNGTRKPNLRMIENYQRDFYVVLDRYRNYKDKKVWFDLDKCKKYTCTQRNMTETARRVLRFGSHGCNMKFLNRNPYLFGTDIRSTTLIKHEYEERWGHLKSNFVTAHLDIERDIEAERDKQEISMISVTIGNEVKQIINRSFVNDTDERFIQAIKDEFQRSVVPRLNSIYNAEKESDRKKYKNMVRRKFTLDIEIVDHEYECVTKIFEFIHSRSPDILSVWNLSYDLEKMDIALSRAGINPADVYSDPSVPYKYRKYHFQKGQPKIFDANGKGENIDITERFHRVHVPSSFYWADQMVMRRLIRKHKSKESSYKLGDMLNKTFGFGKLSADTCPDNIKDTSPGWHKWMSKFNKIFYAVYNIFDNVGSQLLDDYTIDLQSTFPAQVGVSDLEGYGSQGRRLSDDQYFFMLSIGKILAGASDQMESELDKYSVTLDGWICTLASHLVDVEMGNKVLEDFPDVFTKCVKWVLDIDVKSSYPSTGVWLNLERATLYRVMCRIQGVAFESQRRLGLNLPSGRVNSIDIMNTICGAPRQIDMLQRFVEKTGAKLKDY